MSSAEVRRIHQNIQTWCLLVGDNAERFTLVEKRNYEKLCSEPNSVSSEVNYSTNTA